MFIVLLMRFFQNQTYIEIFDKFVCARKDQLSKVNSMGQFQLRAIYPLCSDTL